MERGSVGGLSLEFPHLSGRTGVLVATITVESQDRKQEMSWMEFGLNFWNYYYYYYCYYYYYYY